jgi:hypothetical protein
MTRHSWLMLLALAACTKTGPDDTDDTDLDTNDTDTEDTDDTDVAATPTLAITAPAAASDQYDAVDVTYTVTDFVLDAGALGGANAAGHGHVHYYLDNEYQDATADQTIHLAGLSAGEHTVAIKLAENDHTELGIEQSVTFTVLKPSITITTPVAGTDYDVSSVEIGLKVQDFELMGDMLGADPEIGHGHYHVFVDGEYQNLGYDPGKFVVTRMHEGKHDITVQLFNHDHTPVLPEVSDTVTITVNAGALYVELDRSPYDGVDFDSATWPVNVMVDNFVFSDELVGGPAVPGVGHYHVIVDDAYVDYRTTDSAFIYDQPAGSHVLSVELANNDHTGLGAVDWTYVTTTPDRPNIQITSPANGEKLGSSSFAIKNAVENFTFDKDAVGGAAVTDTGHYHVYVDGAYDGLDATNSYLLDMSPYGSGTHEIMLELVQNDHSELSPRVMDVITVETP